jgi:hypothetical protein
MIYTDYAINLIERNQIWKECMEEEKELTGSGRLGRVRVTEWWMASGSVGSVT